MAARTLVVRLLGGFSVEVDGRRVPDEAWRQRRAAAVVKLLALAPRHRLARDQLIDALWPDVATEVGAGRLRKAAHRARRAAGVDDLVVLDGGVVSLLPGGDVVTDVERFEAAARAALHDGDVPACRAAAGLHPGDLLPEDRDEPWCTGVRERLRRTHLAVLAGGELWGRVLDLDPTDEMAHRGVMRARMEAGDRRGALRQFERLRRALRDELGVSPDPASVALYERVLEEEGRDAPTPRERARALLAWGIVHWERSDLAEARRSAAEARALAVDAGLGRELTDASELLGLVAYAQGHWREVFARELLDTVQRTPELAPFVFDANMCMSEFALWEQDGIAAVSALAAELLAAAAADGSQQARALGLLLRGEATLLGGDQPRSARGDLAEAADLHAASGSTTGVVLARARLAQAEAAGGRRDPAWRHHRDAVVLAEASPIPEHLVVFVYGGMLQAADPAEAVALVDDGEAATARLDDVCEPCSMPFRVGGATVCARAGDLERARGHLAEAERVAQMWRGGPWHAAVAEARAALRLAEGATDDVLTLLAHAAAGFAGSSRPRDAARCRRAAAALR